MLNILPSCILNKSGPPLTIVICVNTLDEINYENLSSIFELESQGMFVVRLKCTSILWWNVPNFTFLSIGERSGRAVVGHVRWSIGCLHDVLQIIKAYLINLFLMLFLMYVHENNIYFRYYSLVYLWLFISSSEILSLWLWRSHT